MPFDGEYDRSKLAVKLPTFHCDQVRMFDQRTRFYAGRCGRRWGKALAIDTPLPTPKGWTTMRDVQVNDVLFDEKGKTCRVIAVTDVMLDRPCNQVVFSDRSEITADDDHRWLTWDSAARKNNARGSKTASPKIRTTKDIAGSLFSNSRGDRNHSISCSKALELPEARLLIHPYVLGAWLGDGTSANGGFTCHQDDIQIIEEIRSAGQPVQKSARDPIGWCLSNGHGGFPRTSFWSKARRLGVIRNKHIPPVYLRASIAQRMDLLQGLMDTDGSTTKGRCEFCSCNKTLAEGVLELVLSLGIRASMFEGRATINGKDCGPKYRVKFTTGKPVFRLRRKLDRLYQRIPRADVEQRFVENVIPIDSVPVKCIAVDSESHLYLAGRSFIPTHNTDYGGTLAADRAIKKHPIGWFAPEYKFVTPAYQRIAEILQPVIETRSKTEGKITTISGGSVEFWTLDNPNAGRSRRYKGVIIDEGAFTKNGAMMEIWQRSIRPTLLDYAGWALVLSNTNGIDNTNFFWQICNEAKHGFTSFHAPSHGNPYLPRAELAQVERDYPPLVYQQEYLADFVDWSGAAFFGRDKMLVDGKAVPWPGFCDSVYAVIDTAVKVGNERDGTAVTYFAVSRLAGIPLIVLDWDIQQIEGSMLNVWLPEVFRNLDNMAVRCRAMYGSAGVLIEDKGSGTILLQQAEKEGLRAEGIDSVLTSLGKDARAISVSKYYHKEMVKISEPAYERIVTYKDRSANHFLTQVNGYRVGFDNKDDDLLDTFTYGIAVGLGNESAI